MGFSFDVLRGCIMIVNCSGVDYSCLFFGMLVLGISRYLPALYQNVVFTLNEYWTGKKSTLH